MVRKANCPTIRKKRGLKRRHVTSFSQDLRAVSEIVSTILLLGISVAMVSSVALWLSSIPLPDERLDVDLLGIYQNGNMTIEHQGGEMLEEEFTRIEFLLNDETISELRISDGRDGEEKWSQGETWVHPVRDIYGDPPEVFDNITVMVIDVRSQALLLIQSVQEGPGLGEMPDLSVSPEDISITFVTSVLRKGVEANITVNVSNQGNYPASDVLVRVFAADEFVQHLEKL